MEELTEESNKLSWNNTNAKTRISSDLSLQVENFEGKNNKIDLGNIVLLFVLS